ncbi:MAG: hypothetical protein HY319_16720 [Armatimonadetes bacterium]|nr:hypothetical protein [Armatimonadota bacterium]
MLVHRQEGGPWSPVDKLENGVSGQELDSSYGLWNDREVTSGWFWNKKVERPLDGKLQADEVTSFEEYKKDSLFVGGAGPCPVVTGIEDVAIKVQDGQPVLEETWFFA